MSDEGVIDRVNAEIHGVAIKTIRRWRRLSSVAACRAEKDFGRRVVRDAMGQS